MIADLTHRSRSIQAQRTIDKAPSAYLRILLFKWLPHVLCWGILFLLLFSCHPNSRILEPNITFSPPQRMIERLPEAFPELSQRELSQEWAKELYLGKKFAREMDLYRAITCFKRALFLIPADAAERRLEIEYDIFLAYYTGNKFQDAIDIFETGALMNVPADFPTFNDLLVLLYDAYWQTCQPEKACRILALIATSEEELANGLSLETAVIEADFPLIDQVAPLHPAGKNAIDFKSTFQFDAKSVSKAQLLNAVLPGAGYYYVGQKKSAITSFIINSLFIAAAYQLFDRGYIAAGIITTSLEMGWYFGGINGAGLEAKEYNERLYECRGKEMLIQNRLFPILMIEKGF